MKQVTSEKKCDVDGKPTSFKCQAESLRTVKHTKRYMACKSNEGSCSWMMFCVGPSQRNLARKMSKPRAPGTRAGVRKLNVTRLIRWYPSRNHRSTLNNVTGCILVCFKLYLDVDKSLASACVLNVFHSILHRYTVGTRIRQNFRGLNSFTQYY